MLRRCVRRGVARCRGGQRVIAGLRYPQIKLSRTGAKMNRSEEPRIAGGDTNLTDGSKALRWAFGGERDFSALLQLTVDHAAQHLPVAGVLLHWRAPRWPELPRWYVSQTLNLQEMPRSVLTAIVEVSQQDALEPHTIPIPPAEGTPHIRLLFTLPVAWQDKPLGTLAALLAQTQIPWRLHEGLEFYASMIAHLFANVQLAWDLFTLLEATRHLVESDSVDTVLERLLGYATVLTDTEAGSVLLYDEKEQALTFAASIGPVATRLKTLRVPLASAAGQAFRTLEPVVIQATANGKGHWPGVDVVTGFVTRSLIAVPILARGRPVGVLEVINKRHGLFDTHDVDILRGLAYHAGAVIQQAQMAANQARSLQALRARGQRRVEWLRVLSHELRTPLTVIRGYAELLADEVARLSQRTRPPVDAELLLSLTAELMQGVQRLTETADQMVRAFATMEGTMEEEMVPVPIVDLVHSAWIGLKPRAEAKRLQVAFHLPDRSPTVMGYPQLLQEAVYQILHNAVKFTPERGRIRVQVATREKRVLISVADTGPGIPAEKLDDIFLPFYQAEDPLTRRHAGLGLGLTIAREAVERHGGRIVVESTVGQGSTFTVELPLWAASSSGPLQAPTGKTTA